MTSLYEDWQMLRLKGNMNRNERCPLPNRVDGREP